MNRLIPYGILAAFCIAGTTWITGLMHSAEIQQLRTQHAERMQEYAQNAEQAQREALERQQTLEERIAALDEEYTKELSDARLENERLRSDVDTGNRRLRVLAQRPESCAATGDDTAATGMDDGYAVELSSSARSAYYRLRQSLTENTAQLKACQAYVRSITD